MSFLTVLGLELRSWKAAVIFSNEFYRCQVFFFPIDLDDEIVSQLANVWNTGRANFFL